MFGKILIANRGEIACRVARTARRLGVRTVAVFSDADRDSLHVRSCDEAVHIGPASALESYLNTKAMLEAARRTGAEAIHPGYGFLSENADFAEACAATGITFIGPTPAAIRAMGSKSAAKALMQRAGVPLVPGYHGDDQKTELLAHEAARIGYPVLIKASAGGGGKGMRIVRNAAEFAAQLESCQREARASFGDARVLIERYLERPRHIEMQVFGDTHGNCIHLFERDCSVQRRHQKVLEEAPAPGMTAERRSRMGEAAVAAARAVGYVGAGTIEFIVAPDGTFYFMEMNTRLQVEHPVTEYVTGLDLVEWQLRVAAGEPLPLTQSQLAIRGHAIEARIYAEDPARGFLPSIGTLEYLTTPAPSESVRIDTGVLESDEISPHYDPMIAKLIVHGPTRDAARTLLRQALADFRVVGVANNVDFLARLVDTRAFASADLDTALIERERAALFATTAPDDLSWIIAALAVAERDRRRATELAEARGWRGSPWGTSHGWRANAAATRTVMLRSGEVVRTVVLVGDTTGAFVQAKVDSAEFALTNALWQGPQLRVDIGGMRVAATAVHATDGRVHVFAADARAAFELPALDSYATDTQADGAAHLRAPMPGRVIKVFVETGAAVDKGAPLIVVEAMKMEHTILAPATGKVLVVHYAAGDTVKEGADLIEFAPTE